MSNISDTKAGRRLANLLGEHWLRFHGDVSRPRHRGVDAPEASRDQVTAVDGLHTSDPTIFVTWSFIGFHRWPEASGQRSYLADLHRHRFMCRLEMRVHHDDREVEFHDLQDYCRNMIDHVADEHESCEQIAKRILSSVNERWPLRPMTATVSEDGEVGASVSFSPVLR